MRLIAIWMLTAAALFAQPAISNVKVTASHGSFQVRLDVTNTGGSSTLNLEYGTTTALGSTSVTVGSAAATPARSLVEAGLQPSTRYYFRPRLTAPNGTLLWSCSPGTSGPGWTCDDQSRLGVFTTEPLPAHHGEPELPLPLDTEMPAVTGQTFNVLADCSNLQTTLNACATANSSLVHQILIPSGAVCTGLYNLPAKSGDGTCIIRTDIPDIQLPPEGVRIDPSYAPKLARLVVPFSATGKTGNIKGSFSGTNTQGWRMVGLSFELDSPLAHRKIAISNVSSDGIITTAAPHGIAFWQQLYIAGVKGFRGRGPNGVWGAQTLDATRLKLWSAPYQTMGEPNFTCAQPPCYVPGTGSVLQTVGQSITSATPTTPPVITTSKEHGLFNEPWWNIVSASGSTITLENGHSIDGRRRPIEIVNSSSPAYNGLWILNSMSVNNVTLANGPIGAVCSFNCGQARVKRALHIEGSQGNASLNGSHLFTVVDDFRIQIDDATAGAYTGGGVVAFDPDFYYTMMAFGTSNSRIVIDRCLIRGAQWPNRMLNAVLLNSSKSAVINSWIDNVKNWRTVNPLTFEYEYGYNDLFTATAMAIEITTGSQKKIHNNYLNATGITLFAQEWNGGTLVQDYTVTRNTFYSPLQDVSGSSASIGLYYPKRHHFEIKQGQRFLLEGNVFDGNWNDYTPCAPALTLSPRAASYDGVNQISDITIRSNIVRNSGSGIQITGTDSYSESIVKYMTQRVKIVNNVLHDIDLYKWSSKPNAVGGPGLCGYAFQALWNVEDLSITHNTAFDMRGVQPQFFSFSNGRSEGVIVKHNIFSHQQDNSAGGLSPAWTFNYAGITPPITGTIKQVFDGYMRAGSSLSDNIVIPGVKNTKVPGNWDSSSPTFESYSKADCDVYYAGFPRVTCMGTGAATETANQRIAFLKFQDSTNRDLRLRYISPAKASVRPEGEDAGANFNTLEDALGRVRNFHLRSSSTSATVSYIAPDAVACSIDYGTDPLWVSHSRLSDGGGTRIRNVTLPALTPGTLYYYRLQCATEQPKGSFVTEP